MTSKCGGEYSDGGKSVNRIPRALSPRNAIFWANRRNAVPNRQEWPFRLRLFPKKRLSTAKSRAEGNSARYRRRELDGLPRPYRPGNSTVRCALMHGPGIGSPVDPWCCGNSIRLRRRLCRIRRGFCRISSFFCGSGFDGLVGLFRCAF